MSTVTLGSNTSPIENLGWVDNNPGPPGTRKSFKIHGDTLEISVFSFATGTASALVYVDGVAQTRMDITHSGSFDYYTFWTGTDGDHDVEIIYDGAGTTPYFWTQNVRVTSTGGTAAITAFYDQVMPLVPGGSLDTTNFQHEGPTTTGSNKVLNCHRPNATIRIKGAITAIQAFIYFFGSDTAYFRIHKKNGGGTYDIISGDDPIACEATLGNGFNLLPVMSGLDGTTQEYLIEYYVCTNTSGCGINAFVFSGSGIVAHGYGSTYRDAYAYLGDSLGSPDSGLANGELWPSLISRRNNAACVNLCVGGTKIGDIASTAESLLGSCPQTITKVFGVGGRNDVFGAVATSTTRTNMGTLITNVLGAVSCDFYFLLMPYTGDSAQNGSDDTYILAEENGVADIGDSRVHTYDPRPVLVQPDDFTVGFTAHLVASGNLHIADLISPLADPVIPTGLEATAASSSQIDLTYDEDPANTAFKVYGSDTEGGSYTLLDTVDPGDFYSETGLSASQTRWYKLKGSNAQGDSDFSDAASATTDSDGGDSGGGGSAPPTPTGLVVSPRNTGLGVSWSASAGAQEYDLYVNGVLNKTVTSTFTRVTGLTNGVSYAITVVAVNADGESDPTSAVNGTPAAPAGGAAVRIEESPGLGLGVID